MRYLPTILAILLAAGVCAYAQDGAEEDEQYAAYEESSAETSALPAGARHGLWQGGAIDFDTLPKHDGFGLSAVGANAKIGLPSPIKGHFLLAAPSFTFRQIDVPASNRISNTDMTLYRAGSAFSYVVPRSQDLMYMATIGVSWNGDGKANNSESIELTGLGLVNWKASDEWKWSVGIAYADRDNWNLMPVVGANWKPNDDWNVDLMFPVPKVARKFHFLPETEDSAYWGYLGGSFGAFNSVFDPVPLPGQAKTNDAAQVKYFDFRVLAGIEKKTTKGIGFVSEIGAAFGAKYEIESLNGPYWYEKKRPDPNLFMKSKITF